MKMETKKRAVRRLKIIEGQIKGLLGMVLRDQYCVDIITQSSAIKKALAGVDGLILEHHLSTHVVEQIKSGKETKAIGEILRIYKLAERKK